MEWLTFQLLLTARMGYRIERMGDWEAGTIIGKNHKGAIVTLDERKSKIRMAMPVSSKKARGVTDAILYLF